MKEIFKIQLDPSDIALFVNQANTISNDVNLFQDSMTVSGKSIMGVCALDFNRDIYMVVHDRTDDYMVYQILGNWIADSSKRVE